MSEAYCVRSCFEQPAENHGHPGSISRVIVGPAASGPTRPEAIDSERLIVHTNEYEVGGVSGEAHAHSDQEQFFYLLDGEMEVTVGEQTYQLVAGDSVFLPRNVMHKHRQLGDTPLKFLFISTRL